MMSRTSLAETEPSPLTSKLFAPLCQGLSVTAMDAVAVYNVAAVAVIVTIFVPSAT